MRTNTKQTSFGNVTYTDIAHNGVKCNKLKDGERCPNNAILQIHNPSNNGFVFRCKIHSKTPWLEEINYE